MLETALASVALVAGTPEPLVRAFWKRLEQVELDEVCAAFCRAIGLTLLSRRPVWAGWDLRWILDEGTPSQTCLRYSTIVLRLELYTSEVEARTVAILSAYPFVPGCATEPARMKVSDYLGRPRDSVAEGMLIRTLRQLPDEEVFGFVWEYLDADTVVGLELVRRALRKRRMLETVLARGYREADASSIRWWLEATVPRVGARRALDILQATRDRAIIRRSAYHVRLVLLALDPSIRDELDTVLGPG